MICKIAELLVDVPIDDGMSGKLGGYELDSDSYKSDIYINASEYALDSSSTADKAMIAYLCSGFQFYRELLRFNGMMLHASAIEYKGKAYLFSGPCGMGKSTHTRLWQSTFGDNVRLFNDDKPALRRLEGNWYAYGTPWCGKDYININMKVPLAGICFLKQAPENKIRQLDEMEALQKILPQTLYRLKLESNMDLLLSHLDKLIREIPIFELENRPEPAAAMLSYETMRKAAEEAGL